MFCAMQPRRSLALVAGALVLALPALGSCGFDKATDIPYPPGVGTDDRDGDVDVLAAVVVAAQPGSGTFIASLANNSSTESATFEALNGGSGNAVVAGPIDPPVEIGPRGLVNLADEGGVPVTGEFGAGDFIPLTLNFADGDTIVMNVPVIFACDEYEGLDTSSQESPSATASDETEDPEASPSVSASATDEEIESASPAPEDGESYDCAGSHSGDDSHSE